MLIRAQILQAMPNSFDLLRELLVPPKPSAVEQAMADAQPDFHKHETKSERINMRVRPSDKMSIEETAAALKMKPGDYLAALHHAMLKKFQENKN